MPKFISKFVGAIIQIQTQLYKHLFSAFQHLVISDPKALRAAPNQCYKILVQRKNFSFSAFVSRLIQPIFCTKTHFKPKSVTLVTVLGIFSVPNFQNLFLRWNHFQLFPIKYAIDHSLGKNFHMFLTIFWESCERSFERRNPNFKHFVSVFIHCL
jgi:hypothetical protein